MLVASRINQVFAGDWVLANPDETAQAIYVSTRGILSARVEARPGYGSWIVLTLEVVEGVNLGDLSKRWVAKNSLWTFEIDPGDCAPVQAEPFRDAFVVLGYLDGKVPAKANPGMTEELDVPFSDAVHALAHNTTANDWAEYRLAQLGVPEH